MALASPPLNKNPKGRCVIVGNGESLRDTPLEQIRYPTFAVNRIHKIYPQTTWRPDFYVRTEKPGWEEDWDAWYAECRVHIDMGIPCTFPKIWKEHFGDGFPNITYRNTCRHFSRDYVPSGWHLPMLCDYGTVITAAIQDAVIRGFEEICLVGCDLTGGHFTEDYIGKIQSDLWRSAHELAKRESPVPIFNCTIGGALEVYPRKPIEYVL